MRYGAIMADCPWRFLTRSAKGRDRCPDALTRENAAERHYKTMTLDDIKALPVRDWAADDCALFLWAIDPMLPHALDVGAAWGFAYKTVAFYWVKERRTTSPRHKLHEDPEHKRFPIGTGYWTRANPEQCLLFTRGNPKRLHMDVRKLIISPRREHSRKPDEVYGRIERLVGGPRLEMFARQEREGWDSHGNETTKFKVAV